MNRNDYDESLIILFVGKNIRVFKEMKVRFQQVVRIAIRQPFKKTYICIYYLGNEKPFSMAFLSEKIEFQLTFNCD